MPGKAVGNVSLFTKQTFSESVKGSWNDLEKVDRGTPGGLDSPTLAEQARTVNQHQPAKHQGTWGAGAALNHIWGFLWTGISWDRTAVSAVGQEMGFGSSRNHQKGSWSQGEPGAVQQGISAISVHTSERKKFTGKIAEINVQAILCMMYQGLMKEPASFTSFAEFSQTCETIYPISNEWLDGLNTKVISFFPCA